MEGVPSFESHSDQASRVGCPARWPQHPPCQRARAHHGFAARGFRPKLDPSKLSKAPAASSYLLLTLSSGLPGRETGRHHRPTCHLSEQSCLLIQTRVPPSSMDADGLACLIFLCRGGGAGAEFGAQTGAVVILSPLFKAVELDSPAQPLRGPTLASGSP